MVTRKLLLPFLGIMLLSACSINEMAVKMVSDALTSAGGGTVFTGDDDPELIRDALPFALKMYEALLQSNSEDTKLLLATAQGYVSYANAFVQTPASMLDEYALEEKRKANQRAKKLYLRGSKYADRALELRHPGILTALEENDFEAAFTDFTPDDVPYLYWGAAGLFAAVAVDTMDTEYTIQIPKAVAYFVKALQLDEDYNDGALHEVFIQLHGALPPALMFRPTVMAEEDSIRIYFEEYYAASDISTPEEKARFHFLRAVEIAGEKKAGAYISLASTISVKNQDAREYVELLERALAVDVDAYPQYRLLNIIHQEKAAWLLDTIEDRFFIIDEVQ